MGDDYPAAMKCEEALCLQLIKHPADVEAAVVDLFGEPRHQDAELLVTNRRDDMLLEEADHTLPQRGGMLVPWLTTAFLRLCGVDIQQIESEHKEGLGKPHDLYLVESDDADRCIGGEGVRVPLMISEESLWLQRIRCRERLPDRIAMVVGGCLYRHRATQQQQQPGARGFLCGNTLSCVQLHEAELGIPRYLFQVVTAHSLEKRKLEKVIVELQCV